MHTSKFRLGFLTLGYVPDLVDFTGAFEHLTDEVVTMAKETTIVGATLAALRPELDCVNCHRYAPKVIR